MNGTMCFFAQAVLPLDNVSSHGMSTLLREVMIVTAAAAGVTLLVVLWAVYFRRKRRHHSHHHHHHHHSGQDRASGMTPTQTATEAEPASGSHRRRRRRWRRDHRPRNPTLAETGGLPPVRRDSPPEPQS